MTDLIRNERMLAARLASREAQQQQLDQLLAGEFPSGFFIALSERRKFEHEADFLAAERARLIASIRENLASVDALIADYHAGVHYTHVRYELWDNESANLLADYDDLAAALADLQEMLVRAGGDERHLIGLSLFCEGYTTKDDEEEVVCRLNAQP